MTASFYTQPFEALNNFSAHAVEFEGILYPTSEHAYQAAKCLDLQGKNEIRNAKSPLLAKQVSNGKFKHARRADWNEVKLDVMERILRAKLDQHEEVRGVLLKTGNDLIAEDSPVDNFWGIGKNKDGENHLGKLWMKIRESM